LIFGIGIDGIEVARIEKRIRSENGLVEQLFTIGEIEYCESKRYSAQNYAARFAAKEAFMKAMGTGGQDVPVFREIEIVNDKRGRPALVLHGRAEELVKLNKITNIQVSLSHVKDFAGAIVVLEK
jgi:holo-[acyl-carrier protein] synthase